jgi:hypothetical protein
VEGAHPPAWGIRKLSRPTSIIMRPNEMVMYQVLGLPGAASSPDCLPGAPWIGYENEHAKVMANLAHTVTLVSNVNRGTVAGSSGAPLHQNARGGGTW